MPKGYLSNHAKDRILERHPNYLQEFTDATSFDRACFALFDMSVETRRHLNDTKFMLQCYTKYAYDKQFRFTEYKNALFIIVNDTVVTVLDSSYQTRSNQFGMKKKY